MSQKHIIDLVQSWNNDIKNALRQFCTDAGTYGRARNRAFTLELEINWWEYSFFWHNRIKDYYGQMETIRNMLITIPLQAGIISDRLGMMVEYLEKALKDAEKNGDKLERRAILHTLKAFKDFSQTFNDYEWRVRAMEGKGVPMFRDLYPDAELIYNQYMKDADAGEADKPAAQ